MRLVVEFECRPRSFLTVARSSENAIRILIFNQISDERDGAVVLEHLAASLRDFPIQHVIFAGYDARQEFLSETGKNTRFHAAMQTYRSLVVPRVPVLEPSPAGAEAEQFGEIWRRFQKDSQIIFAPDIQNALDSVRKLGVESAKTQTLITGSLHLVGGALFSLNRNLSGSSSV